MKLFGVLLVLVLAVSSAYSYLRYKRQSDVDCSVVQTAAICTNGYQEDYAYVAQQCSQYTLARSIRNSCRMNSRGEICGAFDTYTDEQTFDSLCGGLTTSCTPECRNFLTTTRDRYGCCVNIFNASSFS